MKIKKIMQTAVLAGLTLLGASRLNAQDIRARTEYTETGDKSSSLATLAVGNKGTEFFRAYNHTGANGDYNSIAGSYAGITAFGSLGDNEGTGIEAITQKGNATLTLNAEHSKNKDIDRLGAGLDYKLGNATLGAAFDNVSSNDYGLAKIIVDCNKNNQIGAGFQRNNETQDNSIGAFWCHYGPEESWGTRTSTKYDWNDNNADKTITFDSIIAQNPTFSTYSSPWIVGRNRGEMYDVGVAEDTLGPERVPLGCRTKQGIVTELKANLPEKSGELTGKVRADLGYTFSETHGIKPTAIGFGSYDMSGEGNDTVGAGIMLSRDISAGNLCLEATATRNLASDTTDVYASLTYSVNLGKK